MERKEVPGKAYVGEGRADGRQPLGLPLGVADGIRIPIEASSTGSTIKPRSVVPWSVPSHVAAEGKSSEKYLHSPFRLLG